MRRVWLALVMTLATSALSAQQPLTVQEAVALALSRHPSVMQAEAAVERAAAAQREQQASLLPALTTDASLTRFQEPMVVAPLHGFDPRQPPVFDRTLAQANLTLGYTVWDGGARGARLTRAESVLAGARASQESVSESLIAETVRRYAALLTAREQAMSAATMVAALESEHARVVRVLAQGRVARVAVLRAEAALSSARADQASADAQLEVATRDLARAIGLDRPALEQRQLARVAVTAVVPDVDAAVRVALGANPDVRRLRAQVAAAGAGETEARSQWWPRLLLGGRYVRYGSGAGDEGGEWQGGMQLSYALFTAGARPAALDRARAETRAASAELAQAELRVAESVDRAHAQLTSARARSSALAAAVTQSTEVARIEKLALDAGAGVQTDYLAAEASLSRARLALTEASFAEVLAWVELARAMGALSPQWLEQNVEQGS